VLLLLDALRRLGGGGGGGILEAPRDGLWGTRLTECIDDVREGDENRPGDAFSKDEVANVARSCDRGGLEREVSVCGVLYVRSWRRNGGGGAALTNGAEGTAALGTTLPKGGETRFGGSLRAGGLDFFIWLCRRVSGGVGGRLGMVADDLSVDGEGSGL